MRIIAINHLKSDPHVAEDFRQIKLFPSPLQKITNIS